MKHSIGCAVAGLLALMTMISLANAQPVSDSPLSPRPNGPKSAVPTRHVLVHATVHVRPGETIEDAAILLEDGRIAAVSMAGGSFAEDRMAGARVHDLAGHHVYAAFIEPFAEVEAPMPDVNGAGAHWNSRVTPQRSALDGAGIAESDAKKLRELGYGAAQIVPERGIFAGRTAIVGLGSAPDDPSAQHERVYRADVAHAMDFEASGWRDRTYPTSIIGAIALMRQTLADADWQQAHSDAPANALTPLSASAEKSALPLLFDTDHPLEIFAADRVAKEFGREAIVMGSGDSYQWLNGVAKTGMAVIVPLRFPAKPDLSTPGKIHSTELNTMLAWEQSPGNLAMLREAGVTVAITSSGVPRKQKFHENLRSAIERGFPKEDALAALTTTPARLLGMEEELGSIEPGKRANLVVSDGPIFDERSHIRDVWVNGHRHEISAKPEVAIDETGFDGAWRFLVGPADAPFYESRLDVSGTAPGSEPSSKPKIVVTDGEAETDARNLSINGRSISFLIDDVDTQTGTYVVSGVIQPSGVIRGTGVSPQQQEFQWQAIRISDEPEIDAATDEQGRNDDEHDSADEMEEDERVEPWVGAPFGAYGLASLPPQNTVILTNATVWTSGPQGVIENGVVIISGGKITHVGALGGRQPPLTADAGDRIVLDLAGKHITAGLIDAHSHTSLWNLGVNEAGQAVSAEVRISDALDPTAINWYRQLAGGLTTAQLLHGSANPIGGQSKTIKLRWGSSNPEAMFIEDAKPGIKFALGENVKQSNWSIPSSERTRYPQTRMGVEAIIRDRFQAAREYAQEWVRFLTFRSQMSDVYGMPGELVASLRRASGYDFDRESLDHIPVDRSDAPPRRDLELDALVQVLAGDRWVHCHSYRQDEILMLCRVAEDFGFKIGTFQHGLEVYKVAEAVREHAIGASLFSDWWAYKFEVIDAIPGAGPLQSEAGVLTSYNSDSDELARRMNLEGAKAYKYARRLPGDDDHRGGEPRLSKQDALNFVTINPAIQLGIDHRTGSLEVGKDADVVVWSGSPLSTLSRVERTFVDGRELFSLEQDAEHRERIRAERERLTRKILASKKNPSGERESSEGEETPDEGDPEIDRAFLLAEYARHLAEHDRHPHAHEPGDCGCGFVGFADEYRRMMEEQR